MWKISNPVLLREKCFLGMKKSFEVLSVKQSKEQQESSFT